MGVFIAVMAIVAMAVVAALALTAALPSDRFDDLDEDDTGGED